MKDWQTYAHGTETFGPSSAPDTIIVFSDFQCPFCAQLSLTLAHIEKVEPGRLRIVHRNLPIGGLHPNARQAALAGLCAARQDKFRNFYNRLFQVQDSIPHIVWTDFAADIGVPDTAGFRVCLTANSSEDELAADSAAAADLGIRATPTMLVEARLVSGAIAEDSLLELLK